MTATLARARALDADTGGQIHQRVFAVLRLAGSGGSTLAAAHHRLRSYGYSRLALQSALGRLREVGLVTLADRGERWPLWVACRPDAGA